MFKVTIKYLGFLKFIPGLALVFDNWLKIYTLITNPAMLDWIDDITHEVLTWKIHLPKPTNMGACNLIAMVKKWATFIVMVY